MDEKALQLQVDGWRRDFNELLRQCDVTIETLSKMSQVCVDLRAALRGVRTGSAGDGQDCWCTESHRKLAFAAGQPPEHTPMCLAARDVLLVVIR